MTKVALAAAITQWDAARAAALATYGEINTWDVSNITDMSELFKSNTIFNSDISEWDTSNVLDMSGMFDDASAFNQDISSWDVSSVTDMRVMFAGTTNFNNGLAAGASGTMSWQGNTGDVVSMKDMFNAATAFNQDISSWDTSSVNKIKRMFEGATSFNNGDNPDGLSSWANNLSAIVNMENMFDGATAFGTTGGAIVQGIRSWRIDNATPVNNMFLAMSAPSYSYLNALTNGSEAWSAAASYQPRIGDGSPPAPGFSSSSTPALGLFYATNDSYFDCPS
jgi:surface protein